MTEEALYEPDEDLILQEEDGSEAQGHGHMEWIVESELSGSRLDKALSALAGDLSRSFLQKLVEDGAVQVDGQKVKSSFKVKTGSRISVDLPEPKELEVLPEDIPLDILYEDDDVLVVNKPKGMVVHPAAGHENGTLVNAVLYHCKGNLSGINGVLRPGIVHRIDRDTTGVLVICKNDVAHRKIAAQMEVHSITRKYRAIVQGHLREDDGTVDAPIGRHPVERKKMAVVKSGGKRAVTHYHVLARLRDATYVECQLETGRTHQIRVHMASIGHPLLGDEVYGSKKNPHHLQGQALHAMVLGFVHPSTDQYMEFSAPLPDYFIRLLAKLEV